MFIQQLSFPAIDGKSGGQLIHSSSEASAHGRDMYLHNGHRIMSE